MSEKQSLSVKPVAHRGRRRRGAPTGVGGLVGRQHLALVSEDANVAGVGIVEELFDAAEEVHGKEVGFG